MSDDISDIVIHIHGALQGFVAAITGWYKNKRKKEKIE